ncbi:DUF167 domain-containing protein [Amaricoccus sp. W119]|uniref:DUF167 domain-containing protein n=1 Tax=Amaricoccus sp. W119 TaxID=3391833 RepID=UPI0039A426AC
MAKGRRAPRFGSGPGTVSDIGPDEQGGPGSGSGTDYRQDSPRLPWREIAGGIELAVRLTPKAGRAAIEGVGEADGQPALLVRVAAPPVDGAANAALIELLAKTLRIPRSGIEVIAGERARMKRLRLLGPDRAERLAALLEAS